MADELGAIRALATAGLTLAQKTSSGRMALARVAEVADPALLPTAVRGDAAKDFAAWRQTPDPLKAGDVEKLLKGAWGDKPSKVLDDLDLGSPVAVTVTSQVHRATRDGADVAVKVLRPGLAELIRADLKVAETLAGPMKAALPQSDPVALIRESSERVLDELDLEHEGAAQRAIARALRGVDGIGAPAPDSELTHGPVLVRGWADGTTIADGGAPPDPDAAARAFVDGLAAAAHAGTLHADPEPGNVVVARDGTLQLIDAGASARVPSERIALAARALQAFVDEDAAGLGDTLVELGWLTDAGVGAELLGLGRELAAPFLGGPAMLDRAAAGRAADIGWDRVPEIAALAGRVRVVPQDIWALRGISTAGATLAAIGATHDWPALLLAALRG